MALKEHKTKRVKNNFMNNAGWYANKHCSVAFFLLGDSPASESYTPTFRKTLSIPSSQVAPTSTMELSVPKRRHMKFGARGIAQKKQYNIQNTAKV
jgi:hypothetical protein